MRQIYSSPRPQNIALLVELFNQHGIETHVSDMPAHRRNDYATRFSYRDSNSEHWPKVSVVHSDDLPRARELLREAGIEPTVRYAADLARARAATSGTRARRRRIANGVRLLLLVIIIVLALLMAWRRYMS